MMAGVWVVCLASVGRDVQKFVVTLFRAEGDAELLARLGDVWSFESLSSSNYYPHHGFYITESRKAGNFCSFMSTPRAHILFTPVNTTISVTSRAFRASNIMDASSVCD
jgi:hypothetical protein